MTTITLAKIGTHKTVSFAVDELARYLKLIDRRLIIDQRLFDEYDPEITDAIWIGLNGELEYRKLVDEIKIDVTNAGGIITGANERAVLIAAYRFLRELGCRWIRPGDDGEIIPKKTLDKAALTVSVNETPSLRYRSICSEGATIYEHFYNMVNWIPKVGLNAYYMQFLATMSNYNRWYRHPFNPHREAERLISFEEAYGSRLRLEEEIDKRSLELFNPGHGWTMFPFGINVNTITDPNDPRITPEYRECFALIDGKREIFNNLLHFTNLCYSRKEVRDVMTDGAVEYVKKHPNVSVLRFGLADGMNNHCECEECQKMRPADWLMTILNELDEKLAAEGLDTIVGFSLYVDTLWPPEKVRLKNPSRFIMNLSPSSRTYSRPLYDMKVDPATIELPPYVRNKLTLPRDVETIMAFFRAWKKVVPCECTIFEYHLMWDHYLDPGYTSCAKILHQDVTGLDKYPFIGFISCQEHRAAFPTGLPMYAMADAMWNKDSKFEDVSRDYYAAAFGEDGPAVEAYLAKMSELFDPAFMRNDHVEAHNNVLERMDGIDALIDGFKTSHIEPKKDVNESWKYLWYHATYAKMYAELVRRYAKEDEAGIEEQTKALTEYHFSIEPEVHTVLDNSYFDEVYQRWIKRVFANKPVEVDF